MHITLFELEILLYKFVVWTNEHIGVIQLRTDHIYGLLQLLKLNEFEYRLLHLYVVWICLFRTECFPSEVNLYIQFILSLYFETNYCYLYELLAWNPKSIILYSDYFYLLKEICILLTMFIKSILNAIKFADNTEPREKNHSFMTEFSI